MFRGIVNQIFYEKIATIQNKIPIKLNMSNINSVSFNQILHKSIYTTENTDITSEYNHPNMYDNLINEASVKYNLPKALIKSVIFAESNFNPRALSASGAKGLMQLMPLTADQLGVTNIWDAKQNIEGGTKYLRELLNRYNGNISLALAAYNAGPGNVDKYGGIPPFKETKNYVNKVLNNISKFV